jgi:hypothetical protein
MLKQNGSVKKYIKAIKQEKLIQNCIQLVKTKDWTSKELEWTSAELD